MLLIDVVVSTGNKFITCKQCVRSWDNYLLFYTVARMCKQLGPLIY